MSHIIGPPRGTPACWPRYSPRRSSRRWRWWPGSPSKRATPPPRGAAPRLPPPPAPGHIAKNPVEYYSFEQCLCRLVLLGLFACIVSVIDEVICLFHTALLLRAVEQTMFLFGLGVFLALLHRVQPLCELCSIDLA